jgi:hypothetical protein
MITFRIINFITIAILALRGALQMKALWCTANPIIENVIFWAFVVIINACFVFRKKELS